MSIKREGEFPSPTQLVERLQEIMKDASWETRQEAIEAWMKVCQLECELDGMILELKLGHPVEVVATVHADRETEKEKMN